MSFSLYTSHPHPPCSVVQAGLQAYSCASRFPHLPTEKTGDTVDTETLVLSTDLNYNSTEFYFLNKTRIDALNLRNKMFQNKDVQVFFFTVKHKHFYLATMTQFRIITHNEKSEFLSTFKFLTWYSLSFKANKSLFSGTLKLNLF